MPLVDWALVFSGPLFRNRLEPDIISRTSEYFPDLFHTLKELGKGGSFWHPG